MTPESTLVIVRALVYADLLTLFGLTLFAAYGLGSTQDGTRVLRLRGWSTFLAVCGLALSLLHLVAITATMDGADLLNVKVGAIAAVINAGSIGTAWLIRMLALVLVLTAALVLPAKRTLGLWGTIGASAVALGTLAWAGHGVSNTGPFGGVHLAADILHLLAAGGWVGALASLLMLLFDPAVRRDPSHVARLDRALQGFSSMGMALVATILVTGIVNVASVVGWVPIDRFLGNAYGQLLTAKIGAFLVMLGLAAANRFWLSPALSHARSAPRTQGALRALRLSVCLELLFAVLVLLIVAALGTLTPPR
jgi:putative copper resistance protein D